MSADFEWEIVGAVVAEMVTVGFEVVPPANQGVFRGHAENQRWQ
jgi:hypothetical protein